MPDERIGIGNIIVPRHVYESIRGYDERYYGWGSEDTDFYKRVSRVGGSVYLLDHGCPKAMHQWHPKNPTKDSEHTRRNEKMLHSSMSLVRNQESYGGIPETTVEYAPRGLVPIDTVEATIRMRRLLSSLAQQHGPFHQVVELAPRGHVLTAQLCEISREIDVPIVLAYPQWPIKKTVAWSMNQDRPPRIIQRSSTDRRDDQEQMKRVLRGKKSLLVVSGGSLQHLVQGVFPILGTGCVVIIDTARVKMSSGSRQCLHSVSGFKRLPDVGECASRLQLVSMIVDRR